MLSSSTKKKETKLEAFTSSRVDNENGKSVVTNGYFTDEFGLLSQRKDSLAHMSDKGGSFHRKGEEITCWKLFMLNETHFLEGHLTRCVISLKRPFYRMGHFTETRLIR